jgi:hypothetical protein
VTKLRCAAAAILFAACLTGCFKTETSPVSAIEVREISQESAGDNLQTLRVGEDIYVTYPDLAGLSLNLVHFDLSDPKTGGSTDVPSASSGDTTFLDRISETPEIDERFGTAVMIAWNGLLNVFYSDREMEGTPVLKWVSGPSEDEKWWIDILPFSGEPLAVLPGRQGDVELYLLRGAALVRQSVQTPDFQVLLDPCDPSGDICAIATDRRQEITIYDRSTRRLYALTRNDGTTDAKPVYTAGAVHHSILYDSRLRVLLYSPEESALLLLEEQIGTRSFSVTPVTLCEGTTAVYLGYHDGLPFFLYSERVVDREDGRNNLLSVLSASAAADGEVRYRKSELFTAGGPIRRLSVVADGSRLLVFFVQDTLKMLTLDAGNL